MFQVLADADFSSYLVGPSALEKYFGRPLGGVVWIETEGSLVDLSRVFDGLIFPGAEYFDAALESNGRLCLFRCMEGEEKLFRPFQASLQGAFRYDISRDSFIDPLGAYKFLRAGTLVLPDQGGEGGVGHLLPYPEVSKELRPWYVAAEIALLVSRFAYSLPPARASGNEASPSAGFLSGYEEKSGRDDFRQGSPGRGDMHHGDLHHGDLHHGDFRHRDTRRGPDEGASPSSTERSKDRRARLTPLEQRFILNGVLTGKNASAGMQVLMDSGFVEAHWPLLAAMDEVPHSKEQHPEGNVWHHTLEAFLHRKVIELELSLGLLLHDAGKPFARESNGNLFDRHAQIGSVKARRFLEDLGYSSRTVEAVEFLVKYHMVPGALTKLPVYRTETVMDSPLFPDLLELYRCDVSSTYRGPDGYYRACKTYRAFLKNRHNPFRTSDGKKRLRLLVE
jgi:hypothetical protein